MSAPLGYPQSFETDIEYITTRLELLGATSLNNNTTAVLRGNCGTTVNLMAGSNFVGDSGSSFTLFNRGISGPMDFKGEWDSTRTYQQSDVVRWVGNGGDSRSYVATNTTNQDPTVGAWDVLSPFVPPGMSGSGNSWTFTDLRAIGVPGGSGPPAISTFANRSLTNQEHPSYVSDLGFTGGVIAQGGGNNDLGQTGLFWLPGGVYRINAALPGWGCAGHQARIHRFEPVGVAKFFYGTSEYSIAAATAVTSWSKVEITEEIPAGSTYGYAIQHAVGNLPSQGSRRQSIFGTPAAVGTTERYSVVSIQQLLPAQS